MGCAQSKIDNEESVARCKERKNLMKEAVVARNAFASAHSAYSISLKNTGAALSDYGHDEAQATTFLQDDKEDPQPLDSATPLRPPPPPLDESLLPPPPPLPDFSPSPVKRSVSLPSNVMKVRKNRLNVDSVTIVEDDEEEEDVDELETRGKVSKEVEKNGGKGGGGGGEMSSATANLNLNLSPRTPPMQNMAWDYFFNVDHHQHHLGGTSLAIEEEDEEGEEEEEEMKNHNNVEQETVNVNSNINLNVNHNNNDGVKNGGVKNSNVTVAEPKKVVVEVEEAKSATPMYTRRSAAATSSTNVNLMQVLNQIDDHFLKASQTAQEVSNLLETTRMHYHSNFADSRGKIL